MVLDALLCYIMSLILKHSDTKWDTTKKNIVNQSFFFLFFFWGGGGGRGQACACYAPAWIRYCVLHVCVGANGLGNRVL